MTIVLTGSTFLIRAWFQTKENCYTILMGDFIVETEARKERGKIWERNKNGEMFEWMTCLMSDERKPLHVFDWQFHWVGGERERER